MRTPTGRECSYYYQDFHRGRAIQRCRLLIGNPDSLPWRPRVCAICPVPDIERANRSPHLQLTGRLVRRWWLLRRVEVTAYCTKHNLPVKEPYLGCVRCQAEAPRFVVAEEEG